ncbi:hypothetical protein COCOBI_03-0670 [Coccomyxa sp. Obi]|nr:hypothetical protein COCOBI_03-0670 [Coccomyxa sp. Obi]
MNVTAMGLKSFDFWNLVLPTSGSDAVTATSDPQDFPVLNDHFLEMQLDSEHKRDSYYNMQELGIKGDMQQQRKSFGFQTTNAKDFHSVPNNYQPQALPTQYTEPSPDLSTVALHTGLPVSQTTSTARPQQSPQSVQLPAAQPPPRTAHVDALAFLPRAAQGLWKQPQSLQQALPAAAHARAAKARGRPGTRGRTVAERSASRGRSRSRSPIRSADVTISDVSGDESDSGEELMSDTTVEDDKEPPLKYKGISFHKVNHAWRTTVFYKSKFALHMGYEREALKAARKYDELCLYLWPDRKDKLNFPKDKYPARKDLEAKWLPVLEAKAAAAEENLRQKAEEAAKHERERAQAKLKAAGGIRKKTAKKGQNKRKKKSSSSSESEFTISDVTLESHLDDDGDDEGLFSSRRSPTLVATRAPRPRREAALEAQKNWNALMKDVTDCEKDSEEGPHQPRNRAAKAPGVQSSALLQPATRLSPLAAQMSAALGDQMEMMDVDAIDEQSLREDAVSWLIQNIQLS